VNDTERKKLGLAIDAGVHASIALALEEHRRAGRTVAVWRDGRVVEILPEPQEGAATGAVREEPPPELP
jgi:hypothetical protein